MAKQAEPRPAPTWTDPAYIAFCDKLARRIRISYVDIERWNTAVLVATWKRDDREIAAGMRMSASSGPKDYFINIVIGLFDSNELIEQVGYIVLNRTPFLIFRIGPHWYDTSRPDPRLVKVEVLKHGG